MRAAALCARMSGAPARRRWHSPCCSWRRSRGAGGDRAACARRNRGPSPQLHRDACLPARRTRRDDAARASERRRQRIRKARQPGGSGARSDPQQRRGALLLPRRQGRPHRAADVSQCISVAVGAAAEGADRILRIAQGRSRSRRRASTCRLGYSSRRTACATGRSCGSSARRDSCSRRASRTSATSRSNNSRSPTSRSAPRSTARW